MPESYENKISVKEPFVPQSKIDHMKDAQKKSLSKESRKKAEVTKKLNNNLRKETTPLLRDYTREILLSPADGEGTPFYKKYLENFFRDALQNPDGRCSQMIASGFLNDQLFKNLDTSVASIKTIDYEYERYRILRSLYKEQKEIYEDENRYLFAICSRRVGKSTLASRLLVADALIPNHRGLYVGVRSDQAKGIGYAMVSELLSSLGYSQLKGREEFTNGETVEYKLHADPGGAVIEFNNGSTITFRGNSKAGEADKYQGFKYTFCVVDEVQSQPCLEYLLNSILGAAMVDVKGSKQLLIGTPPRIPNTYCEKLWNMKDNVYSKYHWDMSKNPFLENDVETEIEIACKKAGVTKDSAFIQREYYGKFVYDTDALIFRDYKTYDSIPSDFRPTKVWIGVDWGFVDHNAIVTTAVDYYTKRAYVIAQTDFGKADSDEQERAVQKAYLDAITYLRGFNVKDPDHYITIVADTNQPATILTLQRAGLPVIKAYKPNVEVTMEQLATEMRTGRLKIPSMGILKEECDRTVWERNDDGNITFKIDDLTFHPNALHALRYTNIQWLDEWGNYEAANAQPIDPADGPSDEYEESPYETITVEEEWK